jgi:hypothetical protein
MSNSPEQSSGKGSSRVLWNRLFILWVVVGFLWIVMALCARYKCPSLAPADRGFIRIDPDPKVWAERLEQNEAYHRWAARLEGLAKGALVYGLVGVLGFFRRGCIVFIIAGMVVVVCECALWDATWVDL